MKTKLIMAVLITILFTATACTSESTPEPIVREPEELDQLTKQILDLQAENTVIRAELATMTAVSEEELSQSEEVPIQESNEAPLTLVTKPDQSIQNICERSPAVQNTILSTLRLSRCSSVNGQELFRIEQMEIYSDLRPGDLDGLVNLKNMKLQTQDNPPPQGIFKDLGNMERLEMGVKSDDTWELRGILEGKGSLEKLNITGSEVSISKGNLEGLRSLEEIYIQNVKSISGNPFDGLEALKSAKLTSNTEMENKFPKNLIRDNPGVENWEIEGFSFAEGLNMASLKQLCRLGQGRRPLYWSTEEGTKYPTYYFKGQQISVVKKDSDVCWVGKGEPEENGTYAESQVEIVDIRPEVAP